MNGQVTIAIAASSERVYALVSDITRYGEWSPENRGGRWLAGAGGPAVGARFKGKNHRRISWSTTCTVLAAEPGREFGFGVGKSADTVWRYTIEPTPEGASTVTESYETVEPGTVEKFLVRLATGVRWDRRAGDLERGMRTTLERLKAAAESAA